MDAPPAAKPARTADMPPMCLACGQMLAGTEEKCPSCGAPIRGRPSGARSGKLTIALVLFLGLAIINGAQATFAALGPEPSEAGPAIGPWTFPISGTVRYENGTAAAGARVTVDHSNETEVRADANGSYALAAIAAGFHIVTFELENHTSAEYKVFLRQKETVDATLSPGTGSATLEDDSYPFLRTFFLVAAVVSAILALLFVACAITCARRRPYALALTGAWLSLASVLTTAGITIIISLILIVLVMRSKKEFR